MASEAVDIEHGLRIGEVPQPLRQLQPIVTEKDAVGQARREGRPIEQGDGQHMKGIDQTLVWPMYSTMKSPGKWSSNHSRFSNG